MLFLNVLTVNKKGIFYDLKRFFFFTRNQANDEIEKGNLKKVFVSSLYTGNLKRKYATYQICKSSYYYGVRFFSCLLKGTVVVCI